MGAPVLLALLFLIAFVIGGLLIRGQGTVRGLQWWLGWALLVVGGVGSLYFQLGALI